MRSFLRGFGWGEDTADRIFALLDQDDSGEIDFLEFVGLFDPILGTSYKSQATSRAPAIKGLEDRGLEKKLHQIARIVGDKMHLKFKNVRDAFRALDLDKDGTVSRQELQMFFAGFGLPKEAADTVFTALDEDGSENVDYSEFMGLFGPIIAPGHQARSTDEIKNT